MNRSNWKGPFINKTFLKKSLKIQKDYKLNIQTWSRQSTILPYLVGTTVNVHNGLKFIKIKITEEMVGHKLGEYSLTRARFFYKKTKKK